MKYLNNEGRPKRYKQYSDGKYKSSLCYSVFYRNRSIYPIEDCSNQKDRQCFQDVQKIKSRINSGYNRINSDTCSVENQVTDVFGDNIAFGDMALRKAELLLSGSFLLPSQLPA